MSNVEYCLNRDGSISVTVQEKVPYKKVVDNDFENDFENSERYFLERKFEETFGRSKARNGGFKDVKNKASFMASVLKSAGSDFTKVSVPVSERRRVLNITPAISAKNMRRTVDAMMDILSNNSFSNFVTLTYNSESPDNDDVNNLDPRSVVSDTSYFFNRLRKRCRELGHELVYFAVFEHHKNGSIHVHYVDNIPQGPVFDKIYPQRTIVRQRRKSSTGWQELTHPEVYAWNVGNGLYKRLKDGSSVAVGVSDDYKVPDPGINKGFADCKPLENSKSNKKYLLKTMTSYISKEARRGKVADFFGCKKYLNSRNCQHAVSIYADAPVSSEGLIIDNLYRVINNDTGVVVDLFPSGWVPARVYRYKNAYNRGDIVKYTFFGCDFSALERWFYWEFNPRNNPEYSYQFYDYKGWPKKGIIPAVTVAA